MSANDNISSQVISYIKQAEALESSRIDLVTKIKKVFRDEIISRFKF